MSLWHLFLHHKPINPFSKEIILSSFHSNISQKWFCNLNLSPLHREWGLWLVNYHYYCPSPNECTSYSEVSNLWLRDTIYSCCLTSVELINRWLWCSTWKTIKPWLLLSKLVQACTENEDKVFSKQYSYLTDKAFQLALCTHKYNRRNF